MGDRVSHRILKNLLFVLGSQILILIISILRSLIVPSFFSVESFGYWQIYLFYSAYVGFCTLGFNDGIYLRYGDKDYNELPFVKIRASIRIFSFMLLFLTILVGFLTYILNTNGDMRFALMFSCLNIFVLGLSGFFTYVLQITNQMKKYSFFSIVDKVFVMMTVVPMFFYSYENFKLIIIVDFLAKILVLGAMMHSCKELVIGSIGRTSEAINEVKENIFVG